MSLGDAAPPDLRAVHSARITRALRSPDALWTFVTSPEPMYLERRAAAYQAKGLLPITWLPKVWQAVDELRREQNRFGLKPHPLNSMMWMPGPASPPPPARRILGHEWKPPAAPVEYPLTAKEREAAPWPWQVLEALNDLKAGFIPSTYGPLEREKADAYLSMVLTMPCGTDDEAKLLLEASQGTSHYKTPAIMAVWRNIALNPRFTSAAVQVSTSYADATRLWNDPRSWAIGAAGLVEIVRDTPHIQARHTAPYWVRSLREVFVDGHDRPRPLPAAAILEISRLALDDAVDDQWTRLYVYAFSVVEALDEKPFPAERNMDPQSPDVPRRLRQFGDWLAQHRRELDELAAAQKPAIDDAAALLAGTATCRATPQAR